MILSEIVSFLTKKREIISEFPLKCFKTTEKHSLALCGSFCGEKQFVLKIVPFFCFEQKHLCTPNPNFAQDFLLFKLVEKSNLSAYFWTSFWDSHFFWIKREVFNEFPPQNGSKEHKNIVKLNVAHFEEKNSFCLYLSSFTALNKKGCLQQI